MLSLLSAQSLKELVQAKAIRQATVVADKHVYQLWIQVGDAQRMVSVRTREGKTQVRAFSSLDAAARFLREKVQLDHYTVDAANFAPGTPRVKRPDTAQRLRGAHASLSHTQWLEQKVNASRAALADGANLRIAPEDWQAVRAAKLAQRGAQ